MDKIDDAINSFNIGNFEEAETISCQILSENPNSIEAIDVLAAIYIRTNNLNLLNNSGKNELFLIRKIAVFLGDLKTYEQARVFYEKALEIEPNDFVGLNNLGLIYENLDMLDKAYSVYEKSLKIKENYPALYNLGVLCRKNKEFSKSIYYLDRTVKIKPDDAYANYSLAMTYFMQKKFEKGYPYFLKRPVKGITQLKNFWNGSKYPDKEILVFCDYGLGDAIMFSRYFNFLKDCFSRVKVCCHVSLKKLFENSFKGIEFYDNLSGITYDYCVLAMNLPYFLNMDFSSIPFSDGYLKVDQTKILDYKNKYFNNNLVKIGICYVGGELQKRNAKYRRIKLSKLEKLFQIPNMAFYSFQKDDVFDELKDYPNIVNLGKTFNDFDDTAAAMKNLDVLITIDSAPVHLAGALGVRTLLMLPYYSEWRWFDESTNTSWYKSVELIRQIKPASWDNVVEKIYLQLKTL